MPAATSSMTAKRPRFPDRQSWLAVGVLCGLLARPALADDPPENRASRLGFKFDQQAHDATVAAEHKRAESASATPPGVVRLPTFVVKQKNLTDHAHEFLTERGRIALAEEHTETPMYRAVIGPIEAVASLVHNVLGGWNPNAPEAVALEADYEQRRRNREMNDLLDLAALADEASRAAAQQKSKQAPSR
ncbi:MAG TPA: hypothetical protein VG710_14230 [Opitutus sp.]|nr:hypothetical protein [Opitutus sp.]